jgi:hypothetical protein
MQRFPIAQARSAFSSARLPFSRQLATGCHRPTAPIGRILGSSNAVLPRNSRQLHTESQITPSSKRLGLGLLASPIAQCGGPCLIFSLQMALAAAGVLYTTSSNIYSESKHSDSEHVASDPYLHKTHPDGPQSGDMPALRPRTECV